jgi:succinate dehydrogenase / fumarate reductase cytochrome b subunit
VYRTIHELTDTRDPLKQDVYSMVVAGFTTPWLAALYVLAQVVLFAHLLHGVQSSFQTLGLKNRRFARAIKAFGFLVAFTILAGNVVIVLGVMAGRAPPIYPSA